MEFDFQKYIQERRSAGSVQSGGESAGQFAYGREQKVLRTLKRARFVELALKATLRIEERWLRSDEDTSHDQEVIDASSWPRIFPLVHEAAQRLGVETRDAVAIRNHAGEPAALALGVEPPARLAISTRALEFLNDDEVLFLIGQAYAHELYGHAPYLSTLYAFNRIQGVVAEQVVKPTLASVRTWLRHGMVTADRGGLLATRSLEVSLRALVKTTLILERGQDRGEVLEKIDAIGTDVEALTALLADEPKASARVLALRAFARSRDYHRAIGETGGESTSSIDTEVEKIIPLWKAV